MRCCWVTTSQRSKMETTNLKTASSPGVYQCIVCQMTTVSLATLHRHQTYRHTPEELSLSTIGLQCTLIKNLHTNNGIVYDNSWLNDPKKQAEFYAVSSKLLNDCNNNANRCVPIDYAVEKRRQHLARTNDAAIVDRTFEKDGSSNLKIIFLDSATDVSRPTSAGEALQCSKRVAQPEKLKNVDTFKTLIEEIKAEDSVITAYEADCAPNVENRIENVIGKEARHTSEFTASVELPTQPKIVNTEADAFVRSIEGLCNDLKNMKNKSQKRKRAPKNPTPAKSRARGKPKAVEKKATIPASSTNNRTVVGTANGETPSAAKNNSSSSQIAECNLKKLKTEIVDDLKSRNVDIVANHDRAEAKSYEKDLETVKQATEVEVNQKKLKHTEHSMTTEVIPPASFTFPWYPSNMNDCSILVLDPEAHQLVWKSVPIVDAHDNGLGQSVMTETTVLPELTEADLLNSEICESTIVVEGSKMDKCIRNASVQSQTEATAADIDRTQCHNNFLLRRGQATARTLSWKIQK